MPHSLLTVTATNVEASIIGKGFGGVYSTIVTIRNPQNPIPSIQAPTLAITQSKIPEANYPGYMYH